MATKKEPAADSYLPADEPKVETVPMHRPEDRAERLVVPVAVDKVDEWKRAGWAVKEAE